MAVDVTWLVRLRGYPYYWGELYAGRCFSTLEHAIRYPRLVDARLALKRIRESAPDVLAEVVKRTKRTGKDLVEHLEIVPLVKACEEAAERCKDAHRLANEAKDAYSKALSMVVVHQLRLSLRRFALSNVDPL